MSQAVNILNYAHELKEAGVPEQQAEIHASKIAMIIDNHLTTKEDLRLLESNIKKDMKESETKMIMTFASVISVAVGILGVLIKVS